MAAPEVESVLARATPRTTIGVACTSITREGGLLTHGEHPAGKGRAQVAAKIRERGHRPVFVVANTGELGFDGPLGLQVLQDEVARRRLVANVVDAAKREAFPVIELDLEAMPTAAAAPYVTFTREVIAAAEGREVAVDVHPKTRDDPGWDGPGAHDYAALTEAGAVLRLMTYDYSTGPVPPGPSTKASWIREVVSYARSKNIPASKLEIGLPAYGYDFPPQGKGPPVPLRHEDVLALHARVKGTIERDGADVPHFKYTDDAGVHEVWYDDARSLRRVLFSIADLAADVRGVAVWGVGRADPDLGKLFDELGF